MTLIIVSRCYGWQNIYSAVITATAIIHIKNTKGKLGLQLKRIWRNKHKGGHRWPPADTEKYRESKILNNTMSMSVGINRNRRHGSWARVRGFAGERSKCYRDIIAGSTRENATGVRKDSLVALGIRFEKLLVGFLLQRIGDAVEEHPLLFRRGRWQRARCIRTLHVGGGKFFAYSFFHGKFRHRASMWARAWFNITLGPTMVNRWSR